MYSGPFARSYSVSKRQRSASLLKVPCFVVMTPMCRPAVLLPATAGGTRCRPQREREMLKDVQRERDIYIYTCCKRERVREREREREMDSERERDRQTETDREREREREEREERERERDIE